MMESCHPQGGLLFANIDMKYEKSEHHLKIQPSEPGTTDG